MSHECEYKQLVTAIKDNLPVKNNSESEIVNCLDAIAEVGEIIKNLMIVSNYLYPPGNSQ